LRKGGHNTKHKEKLLSYLLFTINHHKKILTPSFIVISTTTMARFSPIAVAAVAALGCANGFVIKSSMPSMKPLQMVSGFLHL